MDYRYIFARQKVLFPYYNFIPITFFWFLDEINIIGKNGKI